MENASIEERVKQLEERVAKLETTPEEAQEAPEAPASGETDEEKK